MLIDSYQQIVAANKFRLAAWSLSDVQKDAWRIHSTLVLPENQDVTSLDNKAGTSLSPEVTRSHLFSGILAVGCERGLSVYTLVLENDLLTWSRKWMTA
jgi:hypothetical protein